MPPVSPQLPLPTQPGSNPFAGLDQTLVRLSTGAVFVQTKALRSVALRIQPPAKNAAVLAGKKNVPPLSAQEAKDIVEGCLSKSDSANCTEAQRRKFETELAFFAVNPNPTVVTRQPQKVQISFPFNPSYETNTLKSLGNNNSPGESAGFGGNVLITTGIKDRPWDFFILNAQEASARYTPIASPSTDGLSQQASYQLFLHAYGYNPDNKMFVDNLVPGSPVPPGGLMTFDTMTFGVLNQTGFAPTFKSEKSDFLTPQILLARQNIGLDDLSGKPCVTGAGDARTFCYYLNASLTAGQSFSDVIPLENVNFAASVTLGWNITSEWSLTLPATATAKDYEHVVGGRRDLQLQVGPVLSYSSLNKFPLRCPIKDPPSDTCSEHQENIAYTFKLPVSYYKNYSTLSTAAWSGWVIMPTLSISYNWLEPLEKS